MFGSYMVEFRVANTCVVVLSLFLSFLSAFSFFALVLSWLLIFDQAALAISMLLRLPYIPIAHTQTHYSLPCIILCCRFRLREKQRNRFFITIAHLSVAVCEHAHTYTATYKPSRDKNYVSLHVYRFFFSCLLYALCIHSSAKRSLYGINVVYFAHISYTNIVDLPQKKTDERETRE